MSYYALFDGLRAFYCRYPKERGAAGFSAAAALAFMFEVNAVALLAIGGYAVQGNLDLVKLLGEHWAITVALGVSTLLVHLWWAQRTGSYNSKAPASDPLWRRKFVAYAGCTVCLFLATIYCAVASKSA